MYLFLDDQKARREAMAGRFSDIVFCETAEACIELLKLNVWDVVSLDHDLGGTFYQDAAQKNTGSEVVRFMVRYPELISARKVIVHSWNQVEAPKMVNDLKAAGYNVHREIFVPEGAVELEAMKRAINDPA